MSLKTFITVLVLGSSSLAMAQPEVRDHRAPFAHHDAIVYHDADDRFDDDRDQRDFAPHDMRFGRRQIVIAEDLQLSRGGMHRPTYVSFDQRGRGFRTLRLEADRGQMYVERVALMYADGSHRMISVRQMLSAQDPSITVAIEGAPIGMYVYGTQRGRRASFDVIGMRAGRFWRD